MAFFIVNNSICKEDKYTNQKSLVKKRSAIADLLIRYSLVYLNR